MANLITSTARLFIYSQDIAPKWCKQSHHRTTNKQSLFTQRNQDDSFLTQDKPRADSWAHRAFFSAPTHPGKQKEASWASLIHLEVHEAHRAARRWGAAGETGLEVAMAVRATATHDGRCHCGWWDTTGGYQGGVCYRWASQRTGEWERSDEDILGSMILQSQHHIGCYCY